MEIEGRFPTVSCQRVLRHYPAVKSNNILVATLMVRPHVFDQLGFMGLFVQHCPLSTDPSPR
jgi:hypothetical protein